MVSLQPCLTQQTDRLCTQPTILIVENNPTIQELLMYSFTLSEYRCSVIDERSIASLNWIENTTQTLPDAIILDIDIRTSSFRGPLDFLHACNQAWQRVGLRKVRPLLLLTTQVESRDQLQREGYIVITKPFKPGNLLCEMQAIIEQKQGGGLVERSSHQYALEQSEKCSLFRENRSKDEK